MKINKTIEREIARRPQVVTKYWWEDECAYPWWVILRPGWTYDNPGQHSYNDTAARIAEIIRDARPCDCEDCKKAASRQDQR